MSRSKKGTGDMKPRGPRRRPFVGPKGDEPVSVPWNLTEEQQERLRAAVRALHKREGRWQAVADLVGYPVMYLRAFVDENAPIRGQGQRHFAAKVAAALGVDLDDLLSGKAP